MKQLLLLCLIAGCAIQAQAAFNLKKFDDPQHAERYSGLINELRCLVCQNQTIADSDADLAKDLRNEVYKMIEDGQSDQQIVDFMVQRYGDFVLYNPPVKRQTWLLWGGPFLLLLIGLLVLWMNARSRSKQVTTDIDSIDQEALKKASELLDKEHSE